MDNHNSYCKFNLKQYWGTIPITFGLNLRQIGTSSNHLYNCLVKILEKLKLILPDLTSSILSELKAFLSSIHILSWIKKKINHIIAILNTTSKSSQDEDTETEESEFYYFWPPMFVLTEVASNQWTLLLYINDSLYMFQYQMSGRKERQ